jgi:hypothetical protein
MRVRGALRIRRPSEVQGTTESAAEILDESKTPDDYLQRLLKLIPSEVVGIYLIGRQTAIEQGVNPWWALVCLGIVFYLRAWATSPERKQRPFYKGIQWQGVGAASLSFVIWVHAMGDMIVGLAFFKPWIASLAVLVWGVVAPRIITGDPVDEG